MLRIIRFSVWFMAGLASLSVCWLVIGNWRPLGHIPRFGHDVGTVAVTNISLIDVVSGQAVERTTVVIEEGVITAIGRSGKVAVPANARILDGSGKFLIPGLWDSHIHTLRHSPRVHFPLLIANGVTSIRNLGDGCSWSGSPDCVPDRIEWSAEGVNAARIAPFSVVAASFHFEEGMEAPQAIELVGSLMARGDTLVKLQFGDDVDESVVQAVLGESQRLGIPVAMHLPAASELLDPAYASLTSVEHGGGLLDQCEVLVRSAGQSSVVPRCAALLAALAERRTAFVPTFVASTGQDASLGKDRDLENERRAMVPDAIAALWTAYRFAHLSGMDSEDTGRAQARHEMAMDLAVLAYRAGVPVLVGTDSLDPFVVHGASVHDELEQFVEAGFTTAEALRAATQAPADFHGPRGLRGRVVVGAKADLVMLAANPLERISATRQIEAVFKDGIYFDAEEIGRLEAYARQQSRSHALNARLWLALLW